MAKRDYPNDYFCWFNDDNRLAILYLTSAGSYCSLSQYGNKSDCESNGGTWHAAGKIDTEKWDTYQGADVTNGLRITYHSKYEKMQSLDDNLKDNGGLDSGLHNAIICYVKARLLEDAGDLQKAQYFRAMYEKTLKQYPSRKSGVRGLAVPRL